jgi:hypothetical protein
MTLSTIIIGILILGFILVVIFITTGAYINLMTVRWKVEYEVLKDYINRSDITIESFRGIEESFNELCCNTDNELKLKKKLWSEFMFKFDKVNPYKVR